MSILSFSLFCFCIFIVLRWVDAFKDANGFRFSTYFVSYTSEATCILSGIGTVCPKVENIGGHSPVQDKDNSVIEKPSEDQNGNDSAKDVEELRSVEHQEPASETTVCWLVENSLFQLEIVFPFN